MKKESVFFNKAEALYLMDNDEELFKEIIELFIENCPEWVEELKKAVENEDALKVEGTSHKIKGALRSLVAVPAQEKAQELENIGRSKDLTKANETFKIFNEEINSLIKELEKHIRR